MLVFTCSEQLVGSLAYNSVWCFAIRCLPWGDCQCVTWSVQEFPMSAWSFCSSSDDEGFRHIAAVI
jgi:hypothetical protein